MRVELTPRSVAAAPGAPVTLTVTVTNTTDVISGHLVRVLGVDPAWVDVDSARLSLFPGATGVATVTVTLPCLVPAGRRRLSVQVRELTGPGRTVIHDVDLEVGAAAATDLRLDPVSLTGGRSAAYGVVVANTGNTPVSGPLAGSDEEEALRFLFEPPRVDLGPGEHAAVELRLRGKRPWTGSPLVRSFAIRVDTGEEPSGKPAQGVFVQRPRLSRGAFSLVGLLVAVTVFAVVITVALSGVVGRSAADRNLALQVAQARGNAATSGTGVLAGTVRLLTSGAAVPGVTVDVFSASDVANPVTTAATDRQGAYSLPGLPAGSYKLRFRGAGFAELWYPGGLTDADASTVTLDTGQTRSGLDVLLGGLPATLAGTVSGGDVAGATVTLALPLSATSPAGGQPASGPVPSPGNTTPGVGATVRTVTVGADGTFTLDQVPSPSVYDLVVSKTGFATETQRVDVGGGEKRTGITIRLRRGDGLIAGYVTGADGRIGGATVTATYGQTVVRTVSLTQDDVGAFTLRGLPTPASFTVVVAKPGLASQTLTLSLSAGQQLTGVGVTLGGAAGSLSGTVRTLADGRPAGGVTVTVTNGVLTVSTVTQSTGDVGGWTVDGLAVPSTYTVTFTRSDLASQTVSAALDAFGRPVAAAGSAGTGSLDVALASSTAVLEGTATQGVPGGPTTPAGEVRVTLSSSTSTYAVFTASTPTEKVGRYEIDRLPPGTYTVSVSRRGTRPTSAIVTLAAGQVRSYDPVLAAPAGVSGTVRDGAGQPLRGATVTLYRASEYPKTPLLSVPVDDAGRYIFADVEAPQNYVVEVRVAQAPRASRTFTLAASEQRTVDFSVGEPPASPSPAPTDTATPGTAP